MTMPDTNWIKALILLHLQQTGPHRPATDVWPPLRELHDDDCSAYQSFVQIALAELEREDRIAVSDDAVFLRRPLSTMEYSVEMDLESALMLSILLAHDSTGRVVDPFRLSGADVRSFVISIQQMVERSGQLEQELREANQELQWRRRRLP